jgi:hypothetical protein
MGPRMREPVEAVALRPGRPEGDRHAVERPIGQVDPLARDPQDELPDPRLEPIEPLFDGQVGPARYMQAITV